MDIAYCQFEEFLLAEASKVLGMASAATTAASAHAETLARVKDTTDFSTLEEAELLLQLSDLFSILHISKPRQHWPTLSAVVLERARRVDKRPVGLEMLAVRPTGNNHRQLGNL